MISQVKLCEHCGVNPVSTGRRRRRRFCSISCSSKHGNAARSKYQRTGPLNFVVDPLEHLGLVYSFVGKFLGSGRTSVQDTDEFQNGCLGLIFAAARYDPSKGAKFSTYAYHYIRGYVLEGRHTSDRQTERVQYVPNLEKFLEDVA